MKSKLSIKKGNRRCFVKSMIFSTLTLIPKEVLKSVCSLYCSSLSCNFSIDSVDYTSRYDAEAFLSDCDGSLLSAQLRFAFRLLRILIIAPVSSSRVCCWNSSRVWMDYIARLLLLCSDGSLLSAQRCFAFRWLTILFKSQCWNSSRVQEDYTCKCDADFSLWFSMMSPINNVRFALLVLPILFKSQSWKTSNVR